MQLSLRLALCCETAKVLGEATNEIVIDKSFKKVNHKSIALCAPLVGRSTTRILTPIFSSMTNELSLPSTNYGSTPIPLNSQQKDGLRILFTFDKLKQVLERTLAEQYC